MIMSLKHTKIKFKPYLIPHTLHTCLHRDVAKLFCTDGNMH